MKHELKMRVIGARFTAVLAGAGVLTALVELARSHPAAVFGGLAMWALGNALILVADYHLRRWKVMKRASRRKL